MAGICVCRTEDFNYLHFESGKLVGIRWLESVVRMSRLCPAYEERTDLAEAAGHLRSPLAFELRYSTLGPTQKTKISVDFRRDLE